MSGTVGNTPEFNIDALLHGIDSASQAKPIGKQLHEACMDEKGNQGQLIADNSWLVNGHPLGTALGEKEISEYGLPLLVNMAGGGSFAGVLEENAPAAADPLQYLSSFLTQENLADKLGVEAGKLEKLSSAFTRAHELGEAIKVLREAGREVDLEAQKELITECAEKIKAELDKEGVVYFPLISKQGSYTAMVRVDKENGFSVIEVDPAKESALMPNKSKSKQTKVKQTRRDPLTGRVVEELKTQQFVSFKAKNLEKLGDQAFFEALVKGSVLPVWIEDFDAEGMIYESLPKYIEGSRVDFSETNPELFKKDYRYYKLSDQDVSFKNMTSTLHYMCMDPFFQVGKDSKEAVGTFKKLKFYLQSQIFIAYVQKIEQEHKWQDLSRGEKVFLNDVMHNLLRSAEKLQRNEPVDAKEFKAFVITCRQLQGILSQPVLFEGTTSVDESEEKRRLAIVASIPKYEKGDGIPQVAVQSIDDDDLIYAGEGQRPDRKERVGETLQKFIDGLHNPILHVDFTSSDNANTLLEFQEAVRQLTKLQTTLEQNPSLTSLGRFMGMFGTSQPKPSELRAVYDQYARVLGEFVAQLPVPERGDESYWSQLSEEQQLEYLNLTDHLSNLVIAASTLESRYHPDSVHDYRGYKHSPETSVMLFALYAIQLKLASPSAHLGEGAFNYHDFVYEMRSPKFLIGNPAIQRLVHPLMRYFDPDWNVEELTRSFTQQDKKEQGEALFGFKTVSEHGIVRTWSLDLKSKVDKKSPTQICLEKMLSDPVLKEKVIAILKDENGKFDELYEESMERYRQQDRDYRREKTEFEERIQEIKQTIERLETEKSKEIAEIFSNIDEKIIAVVHKRIELNNLGPWNYRLDAVRRQLQDLEGKLVPSDQRIAGNLVERYNDILRRLDPEILEKREDLRGVQFRLNNLVKPVEPEHPGHYPLESVVDQMACLMLHKDGRSLIPDVMQIILQSSFRAQYFLTTSLSGSFTAERNDMQFQFTGSWRPLPLDGKKKRDELPLQLEVLDRRHGYYSTAYSEICYEWNERGTNLKNLPLEDGGWRDEQDFDRIVDGENEVKFTQNQILARHEQLFSLNPVASRQVRMLGVDPYDSVSRTIGFFSNQINLLSKPKIRQLIRHHLFRPERMDTQLRDNPDLAVKMSEFIVSAIGHYSEIKDIDTCMALLRLGDEMKSAVEAILGRKGDFPDFRNVALTEIIPNLKDDAQAQLKVYRTLVMLHANQGADAILNDEKIEAILQDMLALRVCRQQQTKSTSLSIKDESLIQSVYLRFEALLEQKIPDQVFTQAARVAVAETDAIAEDAKWQGVYPQFHSGDYSLDVEAGIVAYQGKEIIQAPDWIMDSELLRNVYPYSLDSKSCVKKSQWEYVLYPGHEEKEVTVRSYDRGFSIEIIRQIEGQNYRYVPTPEELTGSIPSIFNEMAQCWQKTFDQSMLVYINNKPSYRIELDDSRGIMKKVERIVRLEEEIDGELRDGSEFDPFTESVYRIPINLMGIQQEFPLPLSQLFAGMPLFEKESKWIECWRSQDNSKWTVDLKRLGLSFEIQAKDIDEAVAPHLNLETLMRFQQSEEERAKIMMAVAENIPLHCQQIPGYSLTLPVAIQSLSDVPYLTLQNAAGEKKVMVPRAVGELFAGNSLEASMKEPMAWYDFDVKKAPSDGISSHDITSTNVEQQLFQMLMWTRKKDYQKAHAILEKVNPLAALSKDETKMVKLLQAMLLEVKHPETYALVLKLGLLQERNALKNPQAKGLDKAQGENEAAQEEIPLQQQMEPLMISLTVYEEYRKLSGNAGAFRLTDEEERQIVEALYNKAKKLAEKATGADENNGRDQNAVSLFERGRKFVMDWLEKKKVRAMLGMAEQVVGDRYRFLSTMDGKLGVKKVQMLSVDDKALEESLKLKFIDPDEFVQSFLNRMEIELPIPSEDEINKCLATLNKGADFWKENLLTLYYVARSGTEVQREVLKTELDLATHLDSNYQRLIKWVHAKPGRYPTLNALNQLVRKWTVQAPEKIAAAVEANEKAIQAFDEAEGLHERAVGNERDLVAQESRILGNNVEGRWVIIQTVKDLKTEMKRNEKTLQDLWKQDASLYCVQEDLAKCGRVRVDLEDRLRQCEDLQPQIKAAKDETKRTEKVLAKARATLQKTEKAVQSAHSYEKAMEAKVKAKVSNILPGRLWLVINHLVKPVFKMIRDVWKLAKLGDSFLTKHLYSVRDIFAGNAYTKEKTVASQVDGGFLKEADKSFNVYFDQLAETYFVINASIGVDDPEWNPVDGGDPVIEAKLAKEKAALDEYRSIRKARGSADLKVGADIQNLRMDLEQKASVLNTTLIAEKQAIVWHLNRFMQENPEAKLLAEANRLGQKGELTWEDVRKLTISGDLQTIQDKTGLNEVEAKRLLQGVANYLVKATRLNQIRFVISQVKHAEGETNQKKQAIYHTNIVAALKLVRHYEPDPANLGRLWFEYANGYMYRNDQVQKLDQISQHSGTEILMEAPTGFGKTKAFVPSMDQEKAGKHLVLNVHPRTIEAINAEDIKTQMSDSFGRKADRLHFQRSTEFSVESLKALYEEMQTNFEQGIPINFSAETLQALELHFLLTLFDYQEYQKSDHFDASKVETVQQEIGYFIRILRAVRVAGWATIDESHVNLNPFTNKLIYTIGDSKTLETYQIDIMEEMMALLVQEDMGDLVKITENKQANVTDEQFAKIAENLAEHFAAKYRIPVDKKDEFMEFVLGGLDEVPEWIQAHSLGKKIALVKGVLSLILKSCFNGYVDENFGLSKLHFETKEYAIAYACANTPKENEQNPSQFKNAHETMLKTYLTYLHKGLKVEQVVKMVEFMKAEQEAELRTGVSLKDTKANQAFREICGKGNLHQMKESDVRARFEAFQHNEKAIFYYIRHIVTPQLRLYDKTLVSTPQNLRSMFATSLSLSATPQDPATHGPDTVMVPMEGTAGQVSHLFLSKVDQAKKIYVAETSSPKAVLDAAVKTMADNLHIKCLIDAGGLLRGISNEEIAGKLRSQFRGSEIEAIQYFDTAKEKFVVMEIATGTLADPTVAKVDPAKMLTVFDQPRCFGSDTKQDEVASALLLVNSRTDKSKAGQGAGRMRQWHLEQGMEVMMTQDDYDQAFEDKHREANISDLLTLWVKNLAGEEAKQNYQAQLQQMDNEIRTVLLDRILGVHTGDQTFIRDAEPNVEKAIKLFGKFDQIFVTEDSSDPWMLYAELPADKPAVECLQSHLKRCQKKARSLSGIASTQRKILQKRLGKYASKWKGEDAISLPKMAKASAVDTGTQVEVQVQAEQQVEVNTEEQKYEYLAERTPSKWSDRIKLFEPGWEKPKRQSVFFNRVAKTLSSLEPKNPILKLAFRAALIVGGTGLAATAALAAGVAWPIVVGVGSAVALAMLGISVWKFFAGRNVKFVSNCSYKVRDIMGTTMPRKAKRAMRLFSTNLTASNNFYAQHTPNWRQKVQKPFTQEQKPLFQVLVIQDTVNGEKKLQMMLIDQNDSIYFNRRLQADYEKTADSDARSRKIALYDVDNGIISVQGKNPFDADELESNPEFVSLIAQAKLINGEVRYTEEEQDALTACAKKVGTLVMTQFVQDYVLAEHPLRKALLAESDLHHALEAAV
jgi:hypothetical protein